MVAIESDNSSQVAKKCVQAVGQAILPAAAFSGGAAWYYKILISSRAATISWWDRRFACHRRL